MAPPVLDVELAALIETSTSTLALLRNFSSALVLPDAPPAHSTTNAPDPLAVVHDAAKLLKAHTTKLSLLVINKPFTASAIRKIISQICSTSIPALMSAVELCRPEEYGKLLQGELKFRVRKVTREFEDMMEEVIGRARETSTSAVGEAQESSRKDSLASTGIVWEACDSLMELKTIGLTGLVVQKAQQYRSMIEDAISELREWGEDEVEDHEDEEDDDDALSDGADSIDRMLSSGSRLPKSRQDIRKSLDLSIKQLKLVSTLVQAIIKRRFQTIPQAHNASSKVSPEIPKLLDEVLDDLKDIPDQTDEMASAFYDLDDDEARRTLTTICERGKATIERIRLDWSDKEDEFSLWSDKWLAAIEKA